MPEKVYLDDSGNPAGAGAVYLDDHGNPTTLGIQKHGGSTPKQDRGPDPGQRTMRQLAWRMGLGAQNFGGAVKRNPGTAGAMAAGVALTPFTGGMSLIPAMAAEGGIGAGGAVAGHTVKALATGQMPAVGDVAADAALQGAFGAGGRLVGEGLKLVGGKLKAMGKVAKAAPEPPAAPPSTVPLKFTGTGAVPAARVMGAPSRAQQFSMMVDAPAATQSAAAPTQSAARLVTNAPRPAAAPPNTNVQRAIAEALQEAAAPAAAPAAPAAARATPPLPASWQKLVKPEAPPVAPRASEAPIGLSDDAPFWGRGEAPAGTAGEMRRALGADDAGATLGMSADDVRAAAGGPSHRPMVAELADLDRDYLRQVNNPRGSMDIRLMLKLGKALGLPGIGGMVGGMPGAVVGLAAANPRATGAVMEQAGRVPYAQLLRTALLSADGEQ